MKKKFKMWLFRTLFPSQYVACMSDHDSEKILDLSRQNLKLSEELVAVSEDRLKLRKRNEELLTEILQLTNISLSDIRAMRKLMDIIKKENISYESLKAINDVLEQAIERHNEMLN